MVQAVEQAIGNEVASLKEDVTADADKLLQQVEAEKKKHLGAVEDTIKATERETISVQKLTGVMNNILESEDVNPLLRGFGVLHSSASDLIKQHKRQQVAVEMSLLLRSKAFIRVCVSVRMIEP